MADVLSVVLLAIGIVLGFLALLDVFAKASRLVGVVSIFIILIGGAGMAGIVDFSGLTGDARDTQTQGFTGGGFQSKPPPPQDLSACPVSAITSNQKSAANVRYKNVENSTGAGYLAGTVSARVNGVLIDSVTTNGGSSDTAYVTIDDIRNCGVGQLIATVTTGLGFASSRKAVDVDTGLAVEGYNFRDGAVHTYEMKGASTDVINILGRTNTLLGASNRNVNGSVLDSAAATSGEAPAFVGGTGTADATAYFKNTSVGSKGSINFYIDIQINGSAAVSGAYDEPDALVVSYDTGTAAKFSSNSLSLSVYEAPSTGWALNKLASCPSDIKDNRNVEACWTAPSPKTGGLYRIRGTIVADGGDTIESDVKPLIWFDDKVFFVDTDGIQKYQSFSSSGGTNQGAGGVALQFVMS